VPVKQAAGQEGHRREADPRREQDGGTVDTSAGGRIANFNNGAGQLAFGYVLDGVFGTGGQIIQANSWEVSAFYEHYWTPQWRTSVFGNYNHVDYGAAGDALLFAAFGAGGGRLGTNVPSLAAIGGATAGFLTAGTTGNFDLNVYQIGTRTAWTPVKDLTFSAEFSYSRIDQNLTGTYTPTAAIGLTPGNTAYTLRDQNVYSGSVQALRSF